jgi:microsomal dipeptidase-like Zn-dependent dipeptidase
MSEQSTTTWDRRRFLAGMAATGAWLALKPWHSWAATGTDPRIAAIVARTMGIDTHNHIDVPLAKNELQGSRSDLSAELKRSGLSAICMTFATDYQRSTNPEEAYERFLNGLTEMDAILAAGKLKRALNLDDLEAMHRQKRAAVIQSVEGAHFLNGKIERLDVAYERGLRMLTLLHDSDAAIPLGDVYTNPPHWNGLTPFGMDVVRMCNRKGILLDLAHCSNATIDAALKLSEAPVIISHTGLDTQLGSNERMAQMMRPRLISKEQAKIVAQAGGVIGVWTHLADTPLAYAQNIKALADVVGIDHVCIGTDTKLTPAYRSPAGERPPGAGNNKPEAPKRDQGNEAPAAGPKQDHGQGRPGERTNEAWADQQEGFYYAVVTAMLQSGFNEAAISKIGGGNFCRVFGQATAGH